MAPPATTLQPEVTAEVRGCTFGDGWYAHASQLDVFPMHAVKDAVFVRYARTITSHNGGMLNFKDHPNAALWLLKDSRGLLRERPWGEGGRIRNNPANRMLRAQQV